MNTIVLVSNHFRVHMKGHFHFDEVWDNDTYYLCSNTHLMNIPLPRSHGSCALTWVQPSCIIPSKVVSSFQLGILQYTKEVWEKRLPAITRKASRYYKKGLSLVWVCLLIACSIAVPIGIFYVALDHLPKSQEEKDFEEKERNHFYWYWHGGFDRWWKARLIAFASWVIVMVLFYTPMLMWKSMVSRLPQHSSYFNCGGEVERDSETDTPVCVSGKEERE